MEDVLRSYLVSLGFQVDNAAYNKLKDTLNKLAELSEAKTASMSASYVKASTAIVSSLSAIGFATVDLLDKISQADLGYQKFAMRMYMAKDAAKQLKIVTDAMGESMEDIAWNPELNRQYKELMGQAKGMEPPKDAEGQLRYLRSIRFEFTRMKVEATYGMQQIGYYLFKYLVDPITGSKMGLKEFNDWIQSHMPELASKIARWLTDLFNLGKNAAKGIKEIYSGFKDLFDALPNWGKVLATFGVALTAFFVSGPVGRAVLVLSGLVLLVDDFYGHLEGKNATLGPIWDYLLDKVRSIRWGLYASMRLSEALWNVGAGKKGAAEELNSLSGISGLKKMRKEYEELMGDMAKGPNPPADLARLGIPGSKEGKRFQMLPPSSPGVSNIEDIIARVHAETQLNPDLIRAMIAYESGGKSGAVSSKRAMGLMQLMGSTAAAYGVTNAFDPEQNIMAGSRYLKDLLDQTKGNLPEALKMYNWGMGNMARAGKRRPGWMPPETAAYVGALGGFDPYGSGTTVINNYNTFAPQGDLSDKQQQQMMSIVDKLNSRAGVGRTATSGPGGY